jgi:mannosyl-3-phosphoglycerate phosphatase
MRESERKLVVFTDLDGTLLDPRTYSYHEVMPLITELKSKKIPIVFCSAKTRAEQDVYHGELDINDPFIVENGGAIFIPKDYFSFPPEHTRDTGDYYVIELGIPYDLIRKKLKRVGEQLGVEITGFGDLTAEEVAEDSGLTLELAARAKQREYDETFTFIGGEEGKEVALQKMKEEGLIVAHGGRYLDAMGGNDKGRAVDILTQLFRKEYDGLETIGIGDSQNDLPMLAAVDIPVLVQKPGDRWEEMSLAHLYRAEGVGPKGWVKAVEKLTGA